MQQDARNRYGKRRPAASKANLAGERKCLAALAAQASFDLEQAEAAMAGHVKNLTAAGSPTLGLADHPELKALRLTQQKFGAALTFADVKGVDRAENKTVADYLSNPDCVLRPACRYVLDFIRCTVSFRTAGELVIFYNSLEAQPGVEYFRVKNKLVDPRADVNQPQPADGGDDQGRHDGRGRRHVHAGDPAHLWRCVLAPPRHARTRPLWQDGGRTRGGVEHARHTWRCLCGGATGLCAGLPIGPPCAILCAACAGLPIGPPCAILCAACTCTGSSAAWLQRAEGVPDAVRGEDRRGPQQRG